MIEKFYQYFISLAFIIAIAIPAVIWFSNEGETISKHENRALKTLPEFSFKKKAYKKYPKEFEAYFKDHYGLRHELVDANKSIRLKLFNKSPISRLVRGLDGWLFLNQAAMVEDHIGKIPLSEDVLTLWQQHLVDKELWLQNLGAKYLLVPAPNKMTIYPEYLPTRIQRHSGVTMLDKLMLKLDTQNEFNGYVNLEPLLKIQKNTRLETLRKLTNLDQTESLYFKKDTHWTSFGAFVSYQHIMNKLSTMLPGLSPALTFDDVYPENILKTGDLARMAKTSTREMHHHIKIKQSCAKPYQEVATFKQTQAYKLQAKKLPTITGCDSKNLRAVIVNDSFGSFLQPFFAESFHQVIFMSSYDLIGMEKFLKEFKPDVFIDVRAERNINRLLAPNQTLDQRVNKLRNAAQ